MAHISSKCRLARLKLVTNVPVPQSTWKHTDTHTCLIPGNLTVDSLSRSLSIQQFTSVCSFSHALWSLSVGVLPDTVAGAFLPWKEKWWQFSISLYANSDLPDYLGSSLPDMAQMSWSTVWVTKSPGCNWMLSFSVLVRNTAHFLPKLTTKFSHKMVSWGILALVSSLQNWVKKVNIVLLSRLCITLRHTDVTIGGLDQFALIAGAVDVHVGGTELIKRLHSTDFTPSVNGTSDI